MQLDAKNGDRKWEDAIFTELSSIISFNAFKDRRHHTKAKIPSSYKKITAHLVFAAKHDGRRKARLVAGGHLTDNPNQYTPAWFHYREYDKVVKVPAFEGLVRRSVLAILLERWVNIVVWLNTVLAV
jgi:hypothetical protein